MDNDPFSESNERIYQNKQHVIAREFGLAPNGEMFGGQWVVRNVKTGEYLEHSAYRHDMIEKYT
ncbi:hypothetical protein D9M68_19640 [compost metagenome]